MICMATQRTPFVCQRQRTRGVRRIASISRRSGACSRSPGAPDRPESDLLGSRAGNAVLAMRKEGSGGCYCATEAAQCVEKIPIECSTGYAAARCAHFDHGESRQRPTYMRTLLAARLPPWTRTLSQWSCRCVSSAGAVMPTMKTSCSICRMTKRNRCRRAG